jgi:autotransporter-associated beta strand protein
MAIGLAGVLGSAPNGQAATLIWNGGAAPNGNWSLAANWFGLGTPANGDTVIFQGAAGLNNTNNIAGLTLSQIQFRNGGFSLVGNAFTLTNSILCTNTVGTNTIFANITLATADVQLVVSNGVSLILNNAVGGSVGVVKTGLGNLYYRASNANTYTGTTLIRNGLFNFFSGNANAAFGGPLVIGDGSAGVSPVAQMGVLGDNVPDSIPITVNLGGTLDLNGFNEIIGPLTLSGGVVTSGAGLLTLASNVTVLPSTSTATISGNLSLGNVTRTIAIGNFSAFPDLLISANITGAAGAGITKTGSGQLTLSGVNIYTGPTTIDGFVILANAAALGANGSATNGTTLNANSYLLVQGVNIGNEFLTLAGNSDFRSTGASSWAGPLTFNGIAAINTFGSATFTNTGTYSGPGGFTKGQPGTLRMVPGSGTNSYVGDTTVNDGVLELGGANVIRFGKLTIGDGLGGINADVVRFVANFPIFGGAGGSTVVIKSTGLLDLNGFSDDVGPIALDGSANITSGAGLLTLFEPLSTYDSSGTNTTYPSISGKFELVSDSTFAITNPLAMNALVSGFSGYTLNKTGPGTLLLNSSNSYAGPTVLKQGYIGINNAFALGTTNNGTVVSNGASLYMIGNFGVTNESLALYGPGPSGWGSLDTETFNGTNTWTGPIALNANSTIAPFQPGSVLRLTGAISGPGGFTEFGSGTLSLEGSTANTYAGTTTVNSSSTLVLNRSVFQGTIPGNLDIFGTVRLGADNQLYEKIDVNVEPGGLLDFTTRSAYLDTLRGSGTVNFGVGGWIYVGLNDGTSQFDGPFTGTGYAPGWTVGKTGNGTFTINGNSTYTAGITRVVAGKAVINGQQLQVPVILDVGATLGGSGTVGSLTAFGNVAPGSSPGILTCSNVIFGATGKLIAELNGPTAGSGYDQLNSLILVGSNILANASLQVIPGFTTPVALGQKFTILNNSTPNLFSGTFNGLAEGATITSGDYKFTISYVGGTGNDAVLTLTSIPGAVAGSVVTAGNGTHAIDPNDCNNLALAITNTSASAMTGVNATLSTTTPGVIITQPYSPYPNIPASGKGTNLAPFQISTLPGFVCGTTINLQLSVNSSLGSFTMSSVLASGEVAAPNRYDVTGNVAIPDIGTVESTNVVAGFVGPLQKVTVSLYITHPFDGDLTNLTLISPDGTSVLLSAANGGGGANYGSAISPDGSRTTFDDAAGTAITAGTAPFVGTFRPHSPLSAFNFNGAPNGNWRLRISDGFGGSVGTLRAWSLFLSGTACATGSGACDYCLTSISGMVTNTDPVQTGRINRFAVVSSCGSPKPWPGNFDALPHFYDIYSFTNTTAADACVTLLITTSDTFTHAVMYLNAFDPSNISSNYLADSGSSGVSQSSSASIPPGAKFFVVVHAVASGAGSAPYNLQLSGLPCPPPTLTVQKVTPSTARLSWPSWAGGYLLEATPSLSAINWTGITNEPIVTALKYNVTNGTVTPTNRFYRLKKP